MTSLQKIEHAIFRKALLHIYMSSEDKDIVEIAHKALYEGVLPPLKMREKSWGMSTEEQDIAVELYLAGLSMDQVGRKVGRSKTAIFYLLKKRGIESRKALNKG